MKALILSAGESRRMLPLTEKVPKPLLDVGDHKLLEHHLIKLNRAGITDIVINTFYLGEMIMETLGDGARYGVNISYLPQKELLDSGGDTLRALERLGDEPFVFISSDIYTDFDYSRFTRKLSHGSLGRLLMVWSPEKHAGGCRYALSGDGYLAMDSSVQDGSTINSSTINSSIRDGERWNWSSTGVLHPDIFKGFRHESFPLIKAFDRAVTQGRLEGEIYEGLWFNLSTPEDLGEVREILKKQS